VIDIMPEDREEDETQPSFITYSDDTDANWIRKGNRPYLRI